MNATLKHLRGLGQPQRAGLNEQANQSASSAMSRRDYAPGSYGRGVYARHTTHALDFRTQGSYGRGIYAGHSTADHDYDTPGCYGRGIYAGRSTVDVDFGAQGSFADGV
jgi:hypothetical protein